MPAPLFDLVLLGYRNDLARERVLAYLRGLSERQGGPVDLERDSALPQVLRAAIDHTEGLHLQAELRERGAQVRLVACHREAEAPAAAAPYVPPPPPPAASGGAVRLLGLLLIFGAAALAYLRVLPLPRPLPPPSAAPAYEPAALPAQLDSAPYRLNAEAVDLNASGQFADAAGKLREAMRRDPDAPALRRNLRTVLHNWAVAELNADRTEAAVELLQEGLELEEDRTLLSALGVARLRQGQLGDARTSLERAVDLGAEDPYTMIALGKVYRQQGEREAAVEMFHRARDLGADGPDFRENLARLERELDAEWDFDELRSPHFQISFAGGERDSNEAARAVSDGLEDAYFHVGRKLDLYPDERVQVVLYASEEFHDVTQTPSWTGGVYDGRIKLPSRGVEDGDSAVIERTLRHEYGHVLVSQLTRNRTPVWLSEGVAIWCEEEREGDREDWAYRTLAGEVLFSLRELEGSFTRLPPDRVHVAYAQSYLAVRTLVEQSGSRSIHELLASLGEGRTLDDAFQSVYSRSLVGFESRFVEELTQG